MPEDFELAKSTLQSTRPLFEIAGIEPSVYEDLLNITVSILQQTVTPDLDGQKLTPDLLLEAFENVEGILFPIHK
jgi:ubiquitin thioesterase protein OTUB1